MTYFFNRFKCLDKIIWNDKNIELLLNHIIEQIETENDPTILSISLDKYINHYKSLITAAKEISGYIKSQTDKMLLLLGIKYETSSYYQNEIIRYFDSGSDYFDGLDFISDERAYNHKSVEKILRSAKGKYRRAHVAESQPNFIGIELLQLKLLEGLAHGIHLEKFDEFFPLAKEQNIYIDMAITSNLLTGNVNKISDHPIHRFLQEKCLVTLGTDDPAVFGNNLEFEYNYVNQMHHKTIADTSLSLWKSYSKK